MMWSGTVLYWCQAAQGKPRHNLVNTHRRSSDPCSAEEQVWCTWARTVYLGLEVQERPEEGHQVGCDLRVGGGEVGALLHIAEAGAHLASMTSSHPSFRQTLAHGKT